MYKRVLILAAALLVLFTACSKPAVTKEDIAGKYNSGYESAAECDFFGEKLVIGISKTGGNIEFLVLSPEVLEGVFVRSGGENKISYEGMETEAKIDALPEKSPLSELLRLFGSLSAPDSFEIAESDKEVIVKGADFSAILDGDTLFLRSAVFDKTGAEFVFGEGLFK